ncbi:MAG: alpha/beta hydrolase [FCB group bacterium]|nr:alpha/beta hydrolase [FCB group bacterium]
MEHNEINLSGRKIHYIQSGSGPMVIMIHGITTNSFIWENVIRLLSDFSCIALDLPGCGQSDKSLNEPYSIRNHTEMLSEFIRTVINEPVHLIGHDIGGGICQRFSVLYQEQVKSQVLVNPVGFDYWPVQPIESLRTPIIRQLILSVMDIGMLTFIIRRGFYNKEYVDDALLEKFRMPFDTLEGRKAFLHFARSLDNHDLMEIADRLPEVQIPTVLIRGDADVYLGENIIEKLAECWPHAKLVRTPDAGHFLLWESPELVANSFREMIINDHE